MVVESGGGCLELESGAEQLLDHVVVQVPCDPGAVLEERDALPRHARLGELEGDGEPAPEVVGDLEVARPEARTVGPPRDRRAPRRRARLAQRHREHRPRSIADGDGERVDVVVAGRSRSRAGAAARSRPPHPRSCSRPRAPPDPPGRPGRLVRVVAAIDEDAQQRRLRDRLHEHDAVRLGEVHEARPPPRRGRRPARRRG